jgi:hypothetical protein
MGCEALVLEADAVEVPLAVVEQANKLVAAPNSNNVFQDCFIDNPPMLGWGFLLDKSKRNPRDRKTLAHP